MAKMVRVAIVGTGWGLKVQVPKFREAGLEVVGIYSRSEARAQELAQSHGIKHGFSDIDELCNCDDVDLVSITSPPHLRADIIRKAIAAGKHILTEKPMAVNATEAREMLKSLEGARPDRKHFVDFELRCTPALLRARELVASGAIGDVKLFSGRVLAAYPMFLPGATHSHWHRRDCSGGMWSAVGTHFADCIGFVLQRPVTRVSATEQRAAEALPDPESPGNLLPVTAESAVSVQLELGGSKEDEAPPVCSIVLNGSCPGLPMEATQVIAGTTGTIMINIADGSMRLFRQGSSEPEEVLDGFGGSAFAEVGTPQIAVALQMAVAEEGNEDVKAFRGWRLPDPALLATFQDGVVSQQVADAVHASAAQGGAWMAVEDF